MLATMRPVEHLSQHNHHLPAHADAQATQGSRRGQSASPSPVKSAKAKGSLQRQRKNPPSSVEHKHKSSSAAQDDVFESNDKDAIVASSSQQQQHQQQRQQATPGLLTLSRPIGEVEPSESRSRSKKKAVQSTSTGNGAGKGSQPRKKKTPAQNVPGTGDERQPPSPSMLSKSAPVNSAVSNGTNKSGGSPSLTVDSINGSDASGLTWQQQLLAGDGQRSSPSVASKKASKAASKKGSSATNSTLEKDSLTWQQALMGSGKPRGPTFDVFADARDAATFGSPSASANGVSSSHGKSAGAGHNKGPHSAKGRRQRADSVGEVSMLGAQHPGDHKRGVSTGAAVQLGAKSSASIEFPSTPNKLAYAGPNFHNSPSPASLPMPKFNKASRTPNGAKTQAPSTLRDAGDVSSASSNDDSDGDESILVDQARFRREQTAPAEMASQTTQTTHKSSPLSQPPLSQPVQAQTNAPTDSSDRSATIETLLAKMMMLPSSSGSSGLSQ